jgi:hypothetical protein
MGYLKTILTYHQPSEAEVDKAFLESHGFHVCLLNGNTARNELGAPFFIQLQVLEEEHASATAVLREANPARFGSPARVAELDRQIKRALFFGLSGAILAGVAGYFLFLPLGKTLGVSETTARDFRDLVAAFAAFLGGYLALALGRWMQRGAGNRAG